MLKQKQQQNNRKQTLSYSCQTTNKQESFLKFAKIQENKGVEG
jgi:hypothetical protein